MEKKTHTPAATTSRKCARARRGPAPHVPPPHLPQPRAPAWERRAHHKAAPSGTARGFRPEDRRSPFGSGPSPAPTRELCRSLNIRDQRLAPGRISGEGHEGKDPVTPLPVPLVTQAPALSAAAPSGAASPAACEGGARTFLSEPSREIAAPACFSPSPHGREAPQSPPCRFPRRRYFAGL